MNQLSCYFLFFMFLTFHSLAKGNESDIFYIAGTEEELNLLTSTHFSYLASKANQYTPSDIHSANVQALFKTCNPTTKFPIIENTTSEYWFKFKLKFSTSVCKERWILENLDPHIDYFSIYEVKDGQLKLINETGFGRNFSSRMYAYKNFAYPIKADTSVSEYYIRVSSAIHDPILIKVKTNNQFISYATNEYYLLGIFYGILLIMAIYNLVHFFSLKEAIYIYYFCYVVASILVTLSEDGLGFQYLWPDYPMVNQFVFHLSPLLLTLTFVGYASSFLELKKHLPLHYKLIFAIALLYIVYFPIHYFIIKGQLGVPFYFLPFAFIYILSLVIYLKGNKAVRFFIIGYSFSFISILLLILRMGGLTFWSDIFTLYSFNVGLVIEIVLFSFAISDRVKWLKMEKKIVEKNLLVTQTNLIQQLRENEKLKDKVNQELEEKVKQRTSELEEKSERIAYLNSLLTKNNIKLKEEVTHISKSRIMNKTATFEEFKIIYPDNDSCLKFLATLKWPNDSFTCRKCSNEKCCQGRDTYSKRCTKCSYDESATVNTIFHKLKFPIIKAFYILFLYSSKRTITADELSKLVNLRRQTCLDFSRKVDEAFKTKKRPKHAEDGWSYVILNP